MKFLRSQPDGKNAKRSTTSSGGRSLQPHQIEAAKRMREQGDSWRMLERNFGVKAGTIMAAVDPIYAEKRRAYLREYRAKNGLNGRSKARGTKTVEPTWTPPQRKSRAGRVIDTCDGKMWVVEKYGMEISLPFLLIQHPELRSVR